MQSQDNDPKPVHGKDATDKPNSDEAGAVPSGPAQPRQGGHPEFYQKHCRQEGKSYLKSARIVLELVGLLILGGTLLTTLASLEQSREALRTARQSNIITRKALRVQFLQSKDEKLRTKPRLIIAGIQGPKTLTPNVQIGIKLIFGNAAGGTAEYARVTIELIERDRQGSGAPHTREWGEWRHNPIFKDREYTSVAARASLIVDLSVEGRNAVAIDRIGSDEYQFGIVGTIGYFDAIRPGSAEETLAFCIPFFGERQHQNGESGFRRLPPSQVDSCFNRIGKE